jgi:hypothetical protein
MFLFLQSNERGSPNVILLQELDAFLASVHRVHNDVVEGATCSGYGHIVLLINGS